MGVPRTSEETMSAPVRRERPVSFLLPHLGYGGVERVTLNLARGLSDRGWPVHLVVGVEEGELAGDLSDDIAIVALGAPRVASSLPALAGYLRRARPSVLLSAKTHVNVVALMANRLSNTRTPHVVCEHSSFQWAQKGSVRDEVVKRSARALYPSADRIVAVSGDVADATARATRVPRERIVVISNPVVSSELTRRAAEPCQHPWFGGTARVIVAAGRLTSEKGFDVLIEAFGLLPRTLEVRLIILGEGKERTHLEDLIRSRGVSSSVSLLGYVSNPLPFMRMADLFVLPSRYEGFPMALVEALYCGARIIATDCSDGVRDVLADGEFGSIVERESPRALARSIEEALSDPSGVDRMRLRSRAERYSVERAVESYQRLLAGL